MCVQSCRLKKHGISYIGTIYGGKPNIWEECGAVEYTGYLLKRRDMTSYTCNYIKICFNEKHFE